MTAAAPDRVDSRRRCKWAGAAPDYVDYHDSEWGRPVRDDNGLFERLTLEAFQSGLSWLTILRKRENFRVAFARFDIAAVADFAADDRARLLADPGIVRNRRKIDAAISNAGAALDIEGGLAELIWSFVPDVRPAPATESDIPTQTPESQALSKELKRCGFVFVGPTTSYALMQAAGLVNDHVRDCWIRGRL
ncbi:MAG: DNA-3-methyladenine glycosylase I [Nocardioidaceae bacterium]|nr:DNA-3-methyladenine glycosylase I [Nocardioidaceae bacterium]